MIALCSRTMTARDLLLELDPWLHNRCRYVAARLPGVRADDVYQEAVEEFLGRLDTWLQQDATVSVLAQARSLLTFCVRHAETRAIRERKRHAALPDTDDALERLTEPTPAVDPRETADVVRSVRAGTTPPNVLCLLSLRLPALVEELDAERAKAWTRGGAKAVPRPLPEAWRIYVDGRDRPPLVADDAGWKDHVAVAWYTEGPVEQLSADAIRGAAAKVERYANRGADELRTALLGEGEDA